MNLDEILSPSKSNRLDTLCAANNLDLDSNVLHTLFSANFNLDLDSIVSSSFGAFCLLLIGDCRESGRRWNCRK